MSQSVIDLSSKGNPNSGFSTTLSRIEADLNRTQAIIRTCIQDSPNFGHASTTILILQKFIIFLGSKTSVQFEVYYEKSIAEKIVVLVPGFDPSESTMKINFFGTDVTFIPIEGKKPNPQKEAALGFIGGYEEVPNLAQKYKTRCWIVYQPYLWCYPGALHFNDGEIRLLDKNNSAYHAPYSFKKFPFLFCSLEFVLSEKILKAYCDKPEIWRECDKVLRLCDWQKSRKGALWPVYFGNVAPHIVVHLICLSSKIFEIRSFPPEKIVLPLIIGNEKTYAEIVELVETFLQDEKYKTLRDELSINNKISVRICSISSWDEITSALDDSTCNIVILRISRLPRPFFNFLCKECEFPFVFEGQGTTSIFTSLAKPFLQISCSRITFPNYFFDELDRTVAEELTALTEALYQKPDLNHESYVRFADIIHSMVYGPSENRYYKFFREDLLIMDHPSKDKFSLGLSLAYDFGWKRVLNSCDTENSSSLEITAAQFRQDMKMSGCIHLNTILPEHSFCRFAASMQQQIILVGNPIIEYETSASLQTEILHVTGGVFFFAEHEFHVDLHFEQKKDRPLSSSFRCITEEEECLPGMPWIPFKDPGFTWISEGDSSPLSGFYHASLKSVPLEVRFHFPPLLDQWEIKGVFDPPYEAVSELIQLTGGLDFISGLPKMLPLPIGVREVELLYDYKKSLINEIQIVLSTREPWKFMPEWDISVTPSIRVRVAAPSDRFKRKLSYDISAEFVLGSRCARFLVTAKFPDFAVTLMLVENSLDLVELIHLVSPGTDIGVRELSISSLMIDLLPHASNYNISCVVDGTWSPSDKFTLTQLSFSVRKAGDNIHFYLSGKATVLSHLSLRTEASFATGQGWIIEGRLTTGETPALSSLLNHYLEAGTGELEDAPDFPVSELSLHIESKTGDWRFRGETGKQEPWKVKFLGDREVSASVELGTRLAQGNARGDAASPFYARVEAAVAWNNIPLEAWCRYRKTEEGRTEWQFGFTWDALTAEVTKEAASGHWIGTLSLAPGTTLGDLIEHMVSWWKGESYGLPAPWDALHRLKCDGLGLEYNFTTGDVGLQLSCGELDLGFVTVKGITLTYGEKTQEGGVKKKGVWIELNARFAWQENPEPLAWDASDPDAAPVIDGTGGKYFRLDMLAIGQHIEVQGLQEASTVQKAVDILGNMPEPEPGAFPPVRYSDGSNWMFGTEFGIIKLSDDELETEHQAYMLRCRAVLDDPGFYALQITAAGKAAKIFKGLDIEILYRKVSDTIGVFESRITLPDSMRYFTVGAYSLTMPVLGFSLYTNGDYKVDIGFPWEGDFCRSLSVEGILYPGIPVTGSAGLYFGQLSSATAGDLVPATDKGLFQPVVIFGFGIRIGIGKSVNYGILKAGFSFTFMVILEGVLAQWHPYPNSQKEIRSLRKSDAGSIDGDYYYKLAATAGISGRLYGSIDFCIIKAEVNIAIDVSVLICLESCRPVIFTICACVRVEAKVSLNLGIFSISIHFGFSLSLKETFRIGDPVPAPWDAARRGAGIIAGPLERRLRGALTADVPPNWAVRLPGEKRPLKGYLAAATVLSPSGDVVEKTHPYAMRQAGGQTVSLVISLLLDTVVPASQNRKNAILKANGEEKDSSFETLCKTIAAWIVAAVRQKSPDFVTRDNLRRLIERDLVATDENPIPVPVEAIKAFFDNHFECSISSVSEGNSDPNEMPPGACFPMPGAIRLSIYDKTGGQPCREYDLDQFNSISNSGLKKIREIFDELAVRAQEEDENKRLFTQTASLAVATWLFSDVILLLARQMAQAMDDHLRCFHYPLQQGETLEDILDWIKKHSDSEEDSCTCSLADLLVSNSSHTLTRGKTLILPDDSAYTIESENQTLETLAAERRFPVRDLALKPGNGKIDDLFAEGSGDTIDIPHLHSLSLNELLKAVQRSQQLQHLSGMLSRFLLHGLRLPTDSLDSSSVELPPEAGLYTLTGQQVPLPADLDGFSIRLQSKASWLRFDGEKDEAILKLDDHDRLRIESISAAAQNNNWLKQPAIRGASQIVRRPAVFSLGNPEKCLLGTENASIWAPSGVIPGVTAGKSVKYNVYSGRYDEATGKMQSREEHDFFWATRLHLLVRKLDAVAEPGRRTFELAGMNARDTALLESVIAADMDAGMNIRIGFVSLDTGSILSIPMDEGMTFGIVRSNLSTVTNPGNQAARSRPEKRSVPMRDGFCRFLWEASVTNSGGYYLYYDANGEGLPDAIFDEKGRAELILLLVPKEEKLFNFTNALLLTSYLEESDILYARAVEEGNAPVPEEISLPPQPGIVRIAWSRDIPEEPPSLPAENDKGEWGSQYLANLCQMAAIRIQRGGGFMESRFGVPIGPSSPGPETPEPVCWEYERSICAVNLLEGTTSRNPYAAVGRTLSMQGRWHDIYGNCLDLPPSEATMKFGYNDTLIGLTSWPGATGTWNIAPSTNGHEDMFCLCLRISFDASRYQTDPDQAKNCLAAYRRIQCQLDDPNGLQHEILFSLLGENSILPDSEKLREWVNLIIRSLEGTIRSDACFSYPDDFCWTIDIHTARICSKPLMELSCRWRIKREKASFISPEAAGIDGILQTEALLAPDTCTSQDSEAPISLKKFAADFEAVLPGISLMNGKSGGNASIWAYRQSGKDSVSWQVTPIPRLYAVRPLSNRLLSLDGPVKIPVYTTGEGIKPQTDHEKWLKGIDLDRWMNVFLESFDGILGEHSIGAVGLLDSIGREGSGSSLDELLRIKQSMAESLCELLCPVYEGKTPPPGKQTRDVLKQELLVKLSSLSCIHAVAEYPVTIERGIDESPVPPRFDIAFTLKSDASEDISAAIQFGHAKISLGNHDEATLAFAVKAPPIVKNINGDILDNIRGRLEMNLGMLEHRIHPVKGVEPYESSEWLGFITSKDDVEQRRDPLRQSSPVSSCLGEITIPFPIREYPDLPSLLEQKEENAPQTNAGNELFHWDYGFTYSLPCHYPQDELTCTLSCCETVAFGKKYTPEESLVSDLAVFTELVSAIQNDWESSILDLTPENTSGVDDARAALGAFIQLAGNVSRSLGETLKRNSSAKQSDNESYRFVIRESMERLKLPDGNELDAFTVSLWGATPPWDTDLQVLVRPETHALEELSRPWPEGCIGHWAYISRETGTYLSPREGQTVPERSVRWNNLNLIRTENVRSGLLIRRNACLCETEMTAAPFIYTTGDIKFDSPFLVSRDLNDTIDITEKTGSILSISQHIKNFMKFLFNGMEKEIVKIQIEASYLRPFHPNMPDVELPVFLQLPADCSLSASSLTELASSWEEKFEQFRKTSLKTASGETKPWVAGSKLKMDLIIYTRHTINPKVLLRFRRLELPAEKIAPVTIDNFEMK